MTRTSRDLSGPGQTRAIRDLLQTLFVAELVAPSSRLWLYFGWIADVEVLDNSVRQFAGLRADWPAAGIKLSAVLEALLERRSRIVVITRPNAYNAEFMGKVNGLADRFEGRVAAITPPDFHEKGMLGDDFLLAGSMNLTPSGITVNDEHVVLRRDPAAIEERRLVLEEKWRAYLA